MQRNIRDKTEWNELFKLPGLMKITEREREMEADSVRELDDEWVTLPKELHVPPVWLDGEVVLGPAVFVCLSLCVCICSVVLAHLSDAHTLASVSILHVVWLDWRQIDPPGSGDTNMRQTDFLKILTSSLNALPKQWESSRRREMKTMADPQQKCTINEC